MLDYRKYRVLAKDREPLVHFMMDALICEGCKILWRSDPGEAPFRISFETPLGERMGIVAYAFLANNRPTKNRPLDEHRFQIKYGARDGLPHSVWQDPYSLYTTLFLGINPELGFFVGADPVLHNPTLMYISFEFKEEQARRILQLGWDCWERQKTSGGFDSRVETVVGGRPERFLDYIRFEQAARGLDQGHRLLLAEQVGRHGLHSFALHQRFGGNRPTVPETAEIHRLAREFELDTDQILSLIDSAPRLKMAVRGWVAETHLETHLRTIPQILELTHIERDGEPDFEILVEGGNRLRLECKNVLRKPLADGTVQVDFQKTRASLADPCSRFYSPNEFQILAACLHPSTERWEFKYQLTRDLAVHKRCPGRLDNRVRLGPSWFNTFEELLQAV